MLDSATSSNIQKPLLTKLNAICSASSRPQKPQMSLTPYMKQLEEELVEEDIKLLRKKARKSEDFSKSLEYLFNSLVPFSWPMSGFHMLRTIPLFPFPTQISWNSIVLHLTICMFPIPLVMISLFVYRRALLSIQKSITPIPLGRRILFHLKIMPICQCVQAY